MVTSLKKVMGHESWVMGRRLWVIGWIIFLTQHPTPSIQHLAYAQSSQYIRVAVVKDASSLILKIAGEYEMADSSSRKILLRGNNIKTTVVVSKNSIFLGGRRFSGRKILIKVLAPQSDISLDGRKFRGDIEFIREGARLSAINYVDLEDYIKGILYHEASHYWPQEALKSQAIACRTYAVYQMRQNASRDFDVTADIYSQVYGGKTSERYRTNEAVDSTKEKVLTYKGAVFPAYYHATCAGNTEDASLLWSIDLAPLKGVSCVFCKDSPHFNWHIVLTQDEIAESLKGSGYKYKGAIKEIVIMGKDTSGRITNLKLVTDKKELLISAKDFRNIIGPNQIRSTNFKVNVPGDDLVFEGHGWGHGVGMCQWGSYFMAKQGASCDEILQYYYPGALVSLIVR